MARSANWKPCTWITPEPRGLALICHPNPVQGGTMLNKVVSTLQRTARDAGLITLRFNYRGVGASAGTHDMATGEVDDAEAAATWLRAKHPDLPMTFFGFSFGGYVAASLGGRLEAQGRASRSTCSWSRRRSCAWAITDQLPQNGCP